jgi:excinuclease ABC subunit C
MRYEWQPSTRLIPTSAGVYRFITKTSSGEETIYVGKAKNLRNRLTNYFQDPSKLHERTASMVSAATDLKWTVTQTEIEALQLEFAWIKSYNPRFNIRFRDDKSYPYLSISMQNEIPRVHSTRNKRKDGARYFGPYPNPRDVRDAIELLLRVFPVRSCSDSILSQHQRAKRPCLLGHIGRCLAPCVDDSGIPEHKIVARDLETFLGGSAKQAMATLVSKMTDASAAERFEEAARIRDQISAVEEILKKSLVSIEQDLSADFIGVATSGLDAVVVVMQVREGRLVGENRLLVDAIDAVSDQELLVNFIMRNYSGSDAMSVICVGIELDELSKIEKVLKNLRNSTVSLSSPVRGEKQRVAKLAQMNAEAGLIHHQQKMLSNLASRSEALAELAAALKLKAAPLRIECVDVSHLQGTDRVAAVVVFEDGMPARSEYRSYVLEHPGDDLAGISEVISRRIHRYAENGNRYPTNLLVIDGGPFQARAAAEVLKANGIEIPVIGLAKRLEEVWWPGGATPLMLPRSSKALYLLQQIRDETHRRAITHHRLRRSKRSTKSILDDIPGVGPKKRNMLLKQFGGVTGLRAAGIRDLELIDGIQGPLAARIYRELHLDASKPD